METEILIVGGGLSGIALAEKLENDGANWHLVEASGQLGGRILSTQVRDQKFDLGPAWFWPGQSRMEVLTSRLNLKVFEQYSKGMILREDAAGNIHSNQGIASMQGSLRIEGGMGRIIESLSDRLPAKRIHLNTPLRKLTYAGGVIETKVNGQNFLAKHVVLAIPPRVVAGSIKFDPTLSFEVTKRLQSIPTWMAGQAKILAVYEQPYWREKGFSGDAVSQRGPMFEIHDASPSNKGPYALFGFVGIAPNIRTLHANNIITMAKSQLVTMFGTELSNPLEIRMQDWSQTPAIATKLDHNSSAYHPNYGYPAELKKLWDGQLHFGSTEMGETYGGFLEGALEAAENVYRTIRN